MRAAGAATPATPLPPLPPLPPAPVAHAARPTSEAVSEGLRQRNTGGIGVYQRRD